MRRCCQTVWGRIPEGQEIGRVRAGGACETRKCHGAIAERGAHAAIPHRTAKPWEALTAGAVARNDALRVSNDPGRALWRRWRGHHRRSRVETTMHCAQPLGRRRMARQVDRQLTELHARIALPNGQTALGLPLTEAVG